MSNQSAENEVDPRMGYWQCPCCQSYYTGERIVCPVSGDSRPAVETQDRPINIPFETLKNLLGEPTARVLRVQIETGSTPLASNQRLQDAEHLLRQARAKLASDWPADQYLLKLIDGWLDGSAVETTKPRAGDTCGLCGGTWQVSQSSTGVHHLCQDMSYPIAYPDNIPSGLVPSKCGGCRRLWWVEPPPAAAGHCMCCKGKLRFLIAEVTHERTG
jgi:hypothetical protein